MSTLQKKGLILYKGKYGATEQYAHWLAEELILPDSPADSFSSVKLKDYDFLLIGTSVYTGKLLVRHWLKNNVAAIRHKQIFLFVVSGTAAAEKEKLDAYLKTGIPAELNSNCRVFFLPGRMILEKLSFADRLMIRIAARLAKDPKDKQHILAEFDNVKKEHLNALIAQVRETMASPQKIMPA